MIVAVDNLIPHWEQAFAGLGELRPFSGRQVRAKDVRDVDALIVRSITKVDAPLLAGSSVRFVATASIGTDHLDLDYLNSRSIHFSNAAGSNANAVAEYVVAALLLTAESRGWTLTRKSLAIVGVGNVGSRVWEKACALGLDVILCDPPLRDSTGDPRYRPVHDVLDADILTFHLPLTKTGRYPTYHMVDQKFVARLSPGQFLVNTSRGAVYDEASIKEALRGKKIEGVVIDVWEGEPKIDYSLVDLADLATPHIAGFSLDGKVRATQVMLEELCRFFKLPCSWNTTGLFPRPTPITPARGTRGLSAIRSAVLQAYDVQKDDATLRALKRLEPDGAAEGFDGLRNAYRLRPEFRHYVVEIPSQDSELAARLDSLGFQHLPVFSPVGG